MAENCKVHTYRGTLMTVFGMFTGPPLNVTILTSITSLVQPNVYINYTGHWLVTDLHIEMCRLTCMNSLYCMLMVVIQSCIFMQLSVIYTWGCVCVLISISNSIDTVLSYFSSDFGWAAMISWGQYRYQSGIDETLTIHKPNSCQQPLVKSAAVNAINKSIITQHQKPNTYQVIVRLLKLTFSLLKSKYSKNKDTSMAADALVPCDARSSATKVLIKQDKWVIVFPEREILPHTSYQCWDMIEKANMLIH